MYIQIADEIRLEGATDEMLMDFKSRLTFPNPAYENARKYSKYGGVSLPPFLSFYRESKGVAYLPIGIGFPDIKQEDCTVEDLRVYKDAEYPEYLLTLREEQRFAYSRYMSKVDDILNPSGVICMQTGGGKSQLGIYIASKLRQKTLILVHKNDLVVGWQKDIKLAFGGKVVPGLIKAQSDKIGEQFTIATVQTLAKKSQDYLEKLYREFGLIITDELHHVGAKTFNISAKFHARYKVGLTATPTRADGLTSLLHYFFGDFAFRAEHKENPQDILPVVVHRKKVAFKYEPWAVLNQKTRQWEISYTQPPKTEKFFPITHLEYSRRPRLTYMGMDKVLTHKVMGQVCLDVLTEYKKGHSCIVFVSQIENCMEYYDYLKDFIPESDLGLFCGSNSEKENLEVLEIAERKRKFVTIATYKKATEGTNVQQWEVAFFASSMNSGNNTEQAVGRIRRKKKDGEKLEVAEVYDYDYAECYSFNRHFATRLMRYREMKFKIQGIISQTSRKIFSRGF